MKKKRIKLLGVVPLAGMLTMLSACSNKEKEQEAASSTSAVQTADAQAAGGQNTTAAAAAGQTNSTQVSDGQTAGGTAGVQEAAGGANTTSAAAGTQEQGTTATVAAGALPQVTENPTDESLTEGYSCMYIATADNADKIEWRAASPDGKIDIAYSEISEYFPYMDYMGENEEALSLWNIPADFEGWESYCRFTNSAGSADSRHAVTHVTPMQDAESSQQGQNQQVQAEQPVQTEQQAQTGQQPLQAEQPVQTEIAQ